MKDKKDKENISDFSKDLRKEMDDKVKSSDMELLSPKEVLDLAKDTYEGKLELALEMQKKDYEEKLKDLTTELKKVKPIANKKFIKDWDKVIKNIRLEFFTIKVKGSRGQCPFCLAFRELGLEDELKQLHKNLNISEEKYELKIWHIDQADRYLDSESDPNYTDRLTPEGMNWYYVRGLGINKFPAFELFIIFNPNKTLKNQFLRRQGIGKKDGQYHFEGLIEHMINYIRNLDMKYISNIHLHKEDVQYQDFAQDHKYGE